MLSGEMDQYVNFLPDVQGMRTIYIVHVHVLFMCFDTRPLLLANAS